MGSLETGFDQPKNPEVSGSPLTAPEVQLGLMLLAYREKHKHESDLPNITPTSFEESGETTFMMARDEWVDETHGVSFSERLRLYTEENPAERVNPRDETALAELLEKVQTWKPRTLH